MNRVDLNGKIQFLKLKENYLQKTFVVIVIFARRRFKQHQFLDVIFVRINGYVGYVKKSIKNIEIVRLWIIQ